MNELKIFESITIAELRRRLRITDASDPQYIERVFASINVTYDDSTLVKISKASAVRAYRGMSGHIEANAFVENGELVIG